jgi:hypothetical protein
MANPETVSSQHGHAEAISASEHGHIQVVRIDFGREVMWIIAIFCMCLVIFAATVGYFIANDKAKEQAYLYMDRQYRMAELKYDDLSVVMHRAGLALPGDYTRGPQGNMDADSFHIPGERRKDETSTHADDAGATTAKEPRRRGDRPPERRSAPSGQ